MFNAGQTYPTIESWNKVGELFGRKMIESQSLWGVGYRRRWYIDGLRVTESEFNRVFQLRGHTPESGVMENVSTSFFRKVWK